MGFILTLPSLWRPAFPRLSRNWTENLSPAKPLNSQLPLERATSPQPTPGTAAALAAPASVRPCHLPGCGPTGASLLLPPTVGPPPCQGPLGPGRNLIFFPNPSYYLGKLSLPRRHSGHQNTPLLLGAEDNEASFLAQGTLPNGLTSCRPGPGTRAGPGLTAQVWPEPWQMSPRSSHSLTQKRTRGNQRERLFSLGTFGKTSFMLLVCF